MKRMKERYCVLLTLLEKQRAGHPSSAFLDMYTSLQIEAGRLKSMRSQIRENSCKLLTRLEKQRVGHPLSAFLDMYTSLQIEVGRLKSMRSQIRENSCKLLTHLEKQRVGRRSSEVRTHFLLLTEVVRIRYIYLLPKPEPPQFPRLKVGQKDGQTHFLTLVLS